MISHFPLSINVQKYMATHDLGIYLYNITNVFHGNKPCQAVRLTSEQFSNKYNSNIEMNRIPVVQQ